MTSADARVAVGKITRVHGVRGEVADPGAEVQLEDGRSLVVEESRPHRGRILVWFRGVSDRDLAERLVQQFLFVPESASPRLPEGSWWDHQLEGCEVNVESGRSLGTLREVIHTAANDVWIAVNAQGAETLVPALRDVVISVDAGSKRVTVREIPGLTAPD